MLCECKFNPISDVEEVVPDLSVDIGEIMATNVVVSTGDTSPYTKETDVTKVGHYMRDKIQTVIAAMELQRSLSGSGNSSTPSVQPSTPAKPAAE